MMHPAARRPSVVVRALAAALFASAAIVTTAACDHMFTGNLTPVPPVHRVPVDISGTVILLDKDPTIETRDANHVRRANDQGVPRQYRAAMTDALALAGFRVTAAAAEPHDLVAKLAIAVTEDGDNVRQVYRCGLSALDGTPVVQIDWTWPKGTYVGETEVFDFATHNLSTDIATSRPLLAWLRDHGRDRSSDGGSLVDGGPRGPHAESPGRGP